jgi:hypothetical protein
MAKPRAFFGSSTEAYTALETLAGLVSEVVSPTMWKLVFGIGEWGLQSLLEQSTTFSYAILLLSGDDRSEVRGAIYDAPRDNLIFESGVFIKALSPKAVFLVAPFGGPKLKLPTDISGLTIVPCDSFGKDTSLAKLRDIFAEPALKITGAIRKLEENKKAATNNSPVPLQESIPMHGDFAKAGVWFSDFQSVLKSSEWWLPSKMLYSGPGLAKGWARLERMALYKDMHNRLSAALPTLTKTLGDEEITVVDLGIGTFTVGADFLAQLRGVRPMRIIHYVGVDASLEMLAQGLDLSDGKSAALYSLMGAGGNVSGLCSDFAGLVRHKAKLGNARRLFIFFGNTLGNELNPERMLGSVVNVMQPGDQIFIEVTLVEQQPKSFVELRKTALGSDNAAFFKGPLLAVGCPPGKLELDLVEEKDEPSKNGQVYRYVCKFADNIELYNPAFDGGGMTIPGDSQMVVGVVRKFTEDYLRSIVEMAGLEIKQLHSSDVTKPQERRSCYVAAVKP